MSNNYQNVNNLKVSKKLLTFVNEKLFKDTKISPHKDKVKNKGAWNHALQIK